MRNQIIILAAGQGTRMGRPDVPKVLVMLKNKPLILHLLHELEQRHLSYPVVVVGYMAEKVKGVLGPEYSYVLQSEQKGTAHAVKLTEKYVKAENILVLNGDMPFIKADSLRELMRLHHKKQSLLTMFTTKVPNFEAFYKTLEHYGRIIRNHQGQIIKITEYKDASPNEKQIKELNPAIYMFSAKWLWQNIKLVKNKNAQSEYYLTDLVEIAIKQKLAINSLPINPREVMGINSMEDLKLAEDLT